jgi:hypothetical protein
MVVESIAIREFTAQPPVDQMKMLRLVGVNFQSENGHAANCQEQHNYD